MSGGLRNVLRKPRAAASSASGVPGSVIATKREPGSAMPFPFSQTSKYFWNDSVSVVVPDLVETRNSVRGPRLGRGHGLGGRVVEHPHVEVPRRRAERLAQDLRSEARAAHPEQQRGAEARGPRLLHEGAERWELRLHHLDDVEPAQPRLDHLAVRRIAGPEAGVVLPHPRRRVLAREPRERVRQRPLDLPQLPAHGKCCQPGILHPASSSRGLKSSLWAHSTRGARAGPPRPLAGGPASTARGPSARPRAAYLSMSPRGSCGPAARGGLRGGACAARAGWFTLPGRE